MQLTQKVTVDKVGARKLVAEEIKTIKSKSNTLHQYSRKILKGL